MPASTQVNRATVRHTPLEGQAKAEALSTLDNVCAAATACTEVQGSPIGQQTLVVLQKAVTTAHGSLSNKLSLAQALMAAAKALDIDFGTVKTALGAYEAAVNVIAAGDASVISKAGLLARDPSTAPAALGKVTVVRARVGKHPMEAIISWPKPPGATGYAIEVNFTPQSSTGVYVALNSGTSRRRVVKGPTPGCQFLVRVAALASDGTPSEWSDAILATAL